MQRLIISISSQLPLFGGDIYVRIPTQYSAKVKRLLNKRPFVWTLASPYRMYTDNNWLQCQSMHGEEHAMRLCRFNDDRLGLVEGSTIYDVTSSTETLPSRRWPFPMG